MNSWNIDIVILSHRQTTVVAQSGDGAFDLPEAFEAVEFAAADASRPVRNPIKTSSETRASQSRREQRPTVGSGRTPGSTVEPRSLPFGFLPCCRGCRPTADEKLHQGIRQGRCSRSHKARSPSLGRSGTANSAPGSAGQKSPRHRPRR